MKIDNNNVAGLGLDRSAGAAPAARYGAGNAAGINGNDANSDQINLSDLSRQLRVEQPDSAERQNRIEALAAAYAAGSYNVDPLTVSQRIVDDAIQVP